VRAHLLDVSAGGARAHCHTPPSVGTAVVLRWSDEQRAARVAWSTGNRFGVRFNVPLSDCQIRSILSGA